MSDAPLALQKRRSINFFSVSSFGGASEAWNQSDMDALKEKYRKQKDKHNQDMKEQTKVEEELILLKAMWAKPKVVWERTNLVKGTGKMIATFLEKLRKIEDTYAKNLKDLAESALLNLPTCLNEEGTTLRNAWMSLLKTTTQKSVMTKKTVHVINNILEKEEFKVLDTMLIKPTKEFEKKIDESKKKWEKQANDMVSKKAKYAKVKENEIKNLLNRKKSKVPEDQKNIVKTGEHEYMQYLQKGRKKKVLKQYKAYWESQVDEQMIRAAYHATITQTLKDYQKLEYDRVNLLSGALISVSSQMTKVASQMATVTLKCNRSVRSINKENDMIRWCNIKKTHDLPPWMVVQMEGLQFPTSEIKTNLPHAKVYRKGTERHLMLPGKNKNKKKLKKHDAKGKKKKKRKKD